MIDEESKNEVLIAAYNFIDMTAIILSMLNTILIVSSQVLKAENVKRQSQGEPQVVNQMK